MVTIDHRAAYLASAGMLPFGCGRVRNLAGIDASRAVSADKPAFGIWRVILPAAGQYALPEKLLLPHPAMLDDPACTDLDRHRHRRCGDEAVPGAATRGTSAGWSI